KARRTRARSVGAGVLVRRTRRASYVYAVRGGRVVAVAVATRSLARDGGALRAAMGRLLAARASQASPTFVPNPKAVPDQITGTPLVGSTGDARVNRALAVLCSLSH